MNRIAQKLIWSLAIGILALGSAFVSRSSASPTASINIRVTVQPNLSVAVDSDTYNFGLLPANSSSISTRPILVTNDSLGRTEDYTLSAANAAGSQSTNWVLGSTNGADAFSLQTLSTGDARPSDAEFAGVVSTLATVTRQWNAASNHFAISGSTFTGNNVVASGSNTRKLWFRILTPTTSTDDTEKTSVVTVTANSASTF